MRKSLFFVLTGLLILGFLFTGCPLLEEEEDTSAPEIGSSGVLAVSDIAALTLTLSWAEATDNDSSLFYKIVKADTSAAIDTAVEIENLSDTAVLKDWTKNISTASLSGLSAKSTFFLNVSVKDDSGNKAVYTPLEVTTLPEKLLLFNVGTTNGILGGRTGADNWVDASADVPSGITETVAFLSISASDQLKDIPANYGFPTTVPIYGPDGIAKIADDWADLMDGSIDIDLETAGILPVDSKYSSWWSGSNSDGTVHSDNCSGFTSSATDGMYGQSDEYTTDSEWLTSGTTGGTALLYLLGLGY